MDIYENLYMKHKRRQHISKLLKQNHMQATWYQLHSLGYLLYVKQKFE